MDQSCVLDTAERSLAPDEVAEFRFRQRLEYGAEPRGRLRVSLAGLVIQAFCVREQ